MLKELFTTATLASIVFVFTFSSEIYGTPIEKRIVFPKGRGVVTYRGKLPKRYDYDAYILPAKKGRFIAVKLISADPDAYFAIYETKVLGPDEDTILANDHRSVQWTGQLPVNGEYSIQVYDAGENRIERGAYMIEITIS
mgnify:CR=1 FL=1